jgi:hypothetical protein
MMNIGERKMAAETTSIELQIKADTALAKKGIVELSKSITEVGAEAADLQNKIAESEKGIANSFGKLIPGSIRKAMAVFTQFKKSVDLKAAATGATTFGTAFKTIITGGIQSATAAMKALWAATGPIGVAILAIVAAVVLLTTGIAGAVKAQKEFNLNAKAAKTALDGVEKAASDIGRTAGESAKQMTGMQKAATATQIGFQKLGNWLSKTFKPIVEGLLVPFNKIGSAVAWLTDKLGIATKAEVQMAYEAQAVAEQTNNITAATDNYNAALLLVQRNLELGRLTQAEADKEKKAAMNDYLDDLVKERNAIAAVNGKNSAIVANLDTQIAKIAKVTGLINEQGKAALDAQQEYQKAIDQTNALAKAGLVTEEEAA